MFDHLPYVQIEEFVAPTQVTSGPHIYPRVYLRDIFGFIEGVGVIMNLGIGPESETAMIIVVKLGTHNDLPQVVCC